MSNGVFTAVIAGGFLLAVFGLVPLEQLMAVFLVGGAGKIMGKID